MFNIEFQSSKVATSMYKDFWCAYRDDLALSNLPLRISYSFHVWSNTIEVRLDRLESKIQSKKHGLPLCRAAFIRVGKGFKVGRRRGRRSEIVVPVSFGSWPEFGTHAKYSHSDVNFNLGSKLQLDLNMNLYLYLILNQILKLDFRIWGWRVLGLVEIDSQIRM